MGGDGSSGWGGDGSNQGGQYGGGGYGGGQGGSWGGGSKDNNQYSSWEAAPTTVQPQSCPPQSCPAQTCPPAMTSTKTETSTVTAVSPCMGSTVTAYVTQWMNAPPGCWCGAGSPPPEATGWGWGAMGDAAVFTSSNPSFTPGLSSIPASEAVKTGVTVAGGPPAAAPTAAVSPGGFFGGSSSSAVTTSARSFELDCQYKLVGGGSTFIDDLSLNNNNNFKNFHHIKILAFIILINDNLVFK
ncbi:hypothetical protein Z517_03076 [Fonsecaea pedrosoi CBS 271.37]|uniref:Uncharacterized protein n=1 Tax=Fonsecaea pedrosoi CBS 271.37 TaxID=1442368 RepID=A0A0D2GYZ2_9EURO|nr:uncharacterized protein Z517_03076 [Fonsecaea pedrosoi CBS 271.37]KIW83830.1 hypothetical protein Z517_03076 [Fonsecaea pedrosoi CBS 271.37]